MRRRQSIAQIINRTLPWLAIPAAAVILLLLPSDAFARAGGGGSYHSSGGGGGHSGGGGGGGGDGGGLVWLLFELLFRYPKVGVPVVIIVIVFFALSYKKGNTVYQSAVIRRGQQVMGQDQMASAVQTLRAHDPAFDEDAFGGRVEIAFNKIQAAWCAQDLKAVRPFISDGVHERFLLQFEEQRAEGYRDHMDQIRVDDVEVAGLSSTGLFDEISMRIEAAASDWRESLADHRRISGSTAVEPFVEVWTFVRRRGATTQESKPGLIEGNCPNCGAAVEMNQSANCTHCKALLRSGQYDWVLTEITQQSEWDASARARAPGVAEMQKRDPDFDPAGLEDRASVMFWRKATADRTGKIEPLKKIAAPSFVAAYTAYLRGDLSKGRTFVADCAVGSVQTLGVFTEEAVDRAVVEIRWSGKRFTADAQGAVRGRGEDVWASTLYVLSRQAGSVTAAGSSISSAHCPNCGAPESGGASNACDFCGTVLNDGKHGWVLENIVSKSDNGAQALLAKLSARGVDQGDSNGNGNAAAAPDPMALLTWMAKIATSDGNVDDRERAMLASLAARRNVEPEYVDSLLDAGLRGNLTVPDPSSPEEARSWVAAMAEEAWADGRITREEMQLLRSVGIQAGLSEIDVNQAIRKARADVYGEARDAIRAQKKS